MLTKMTTYYSPIRFQLYTLGKSKCLTTKPVLCLTTKHDAIMRMTTKKIFPTVGGMMQYCITTYDENTKC